MPTVLWYGSHMDVRAALKEAAERNGWSPTRVAAEVGMSEAGIRKFYAGDSATLKSDALVVLMRELPGFAEKLGFDPRPEANGHAA
ncbi:MAG: hypothetical protein JWM87_660 [Candidatus Eremiobacteraeota bacterium]|nr:hypothetical protein [Candidatus Eremiobacteraeota bacterium]